MLKSPIISIVTVVYNAVNTLEKTIQSVFKQTYKNIELIIIDGGSTDGTIGIIEKYSSKISYWVSETDNGIYDAMNKGLINAKGDYITFLNSGDFYCNESVISELFKDFGNSDVIYGDIYYDKLEQIPSLYLKAMDFTKENLLANGTAVVCHQAIFVKREIAPIYDISYKFKAELNWYFDILENNKNLKYKHKEIAVVNYIIGGFGYISYKQNLYEWCKLVIKRFGIYTFFKYKYPKILIRRIKLRYFKNK